VKPAKAERVSPNHGPRPAGTPVDMLILHYTGMQDAAAALDRLCDPAAEVSCHWLIEEDGTLWRLVDESRRAWHAGRGFWAGATDINSRSIGIELVNPGHAFGYRPFPAVQMVSLARLARGILARHPIPPARVLGHSDVAPTRKQDPGELFDWAWLAEEGVGFWPDPDLPAPEIDPWDGLARIGYAVGQDPEPAIVTAFQRHYRPWQVDGVLDEETLRRIAQLAASDSD
jgi:N-acetylmuramoyl-L-alanine amidase